MAVRYERPYSHSAAWSRRLGLFALLLFAVAALGHRVGTMETASLIGVTFVAVVLAAFALVLAIAGLASLWIYAAKGGRAAFWGLILSLVLLVPFAVAVERYFDLPRLHDVSTDLVDPPRFLDPPVAGELPGLWTAAAPPSGPLQQKAYPELAGRRYEGAIDRVLAAVRTVAEQEGIAITDADGADLRARDEVEREEAELPDTPELAEGAVPASPPDPATLVPPIPVPAPRQPGLVAKPAEPARVVLQGEAASTLLALRSDVVIRLIEAEETTRVDMRAVSGFGDHDLGINATLIRHFLARLDAELLGVAGE